MNDLRRLQYFLDIELSYTAAGIFVHQTKYKHDILKKFGMEAAIPCSTPLALHSSTDMGSSCFSEYVHNYRGLIGILHYLTFSRSNIAFAVSKLSQYMHSPCSGNLLAAKRILRYLNDTIDLGILFQKGSSSANLLLRDFSHSDWAGDSNDRRSTTGYVIFLGPNPIS